MSAAISVIVPTFRRDALLEKCLKCLIDQTLPRSSYEVIVADDAPSEITARLLESLACPAGPELRYVPVTATQGPAGRGTPRGECPRRPCWHLPTTIACRIAAGLPPASTNFRMPTRCRGGRWFRWAIDPPITSATSPACKRPSSLRPTASCGARLWRLWAGSTNGSPRPGAKIPICISGCWSEG